MRADRAEKLAAARLVDRDAARSSQRAWREELEQVEDEMEGLVSAPLVSDLPVIGKEARGAGGGKGEKRWPLWIVQLILELLVDGARCTARAHAS